jgi:hypothetical protein
MIARYQEVSMAFQDDLVSHVERIRVRIPHVQGEEATKQALVVPLLQVLGYDVFDPREVRPEYVADFAVKKAGQFEKIDYSIYINDAPAIFVECKPIGAPLADHSGQLSRYFNATPSVRVGIITDGTRLRVFTDLQKPNIMDTQPWLDIDLLAIKPAELEALRRFRKSDFSSNDITALAEEMVYYNNMLAFIANQLREPGDSFVRYVAGEVMAGARITAKVVERLTPILRKAIQSAILENVARSFDRPAEVVPVEVEAAPAPARAPSEGGSVEMASRPNVVTTAEELEAFDLISKWIAEVYPQSKIGYRDSKSYFTIHQDNLRKWFVRLLLDRKPMCIALRHIKPDEARKLAPGIDATDGSAFGDSRLILPTLADLQKARTAVIASYEREASRIADDNVPETADS